jgi:muramoyltetrapeptide carboxypeptidase
MTIGIVSPSSGARNGNLENGIALLESAGYTVAVGDHVFDRHGYLAGMDSARAADFTRMFERREVDAVICARGGYGAARMLPLVDWDVVGANPKLFVGYSDITTLHLAMGRRANLITIHGPMVSSLGGGLSKESKEQFWATLTSREPLGKIDCGEHLPQTLVGGKAAGPLAGGCLALLAAAVGTPDAPDFNGRLVLLEDVDEAAYRVDRCLMQLLNAGILQKAAGFVIGNVTDWEKQEKTAPAILLPDVWRDLIVPLDKPTITGFPFGHEPNPLTLPLGCLAELDADSGSLTILESAVA